MIPARATADLPGPHRAAAMTGRELLPQELQARAQVERRRDEPMAAVRHGLRTLLTTVPGSPLAVVARGATRPLPARGEQVAHRGSRRRPCAREVAIELLRLPATSHAGPPVAAGDPGRTLRVRGATTRGRDGRGGFLSPPPEGRKRSRVTLPRSAPRR